MYKILHVHVYGFIKICLYVVIAISEEVAVASA